MKTFLDEAPGWFLESLGYGHELVVHLVAGRSGEPTDVNLGDHIIHDCIPVESGPDSQRASVRFRDLVAWQVVNESYTTLDIREERDDLRTLQQLSASAYLGYVDTQFGIYKEVGIAAKHYRLCTFDEIIDVVARESPVIEATRMESRGSW